MNNNSSTLSIDALILAGGKSSRMGQPKALLSVGQSTMIESLVKQLPQSSLNNIYISYGVNDPINIDNTICLQDHIKEAYQGPLSGIAEVMQISESNYIWVLACDIIKLPANVLDALKEHAIKSQADIVYAQDTQGNDYPLIALWRMSVANQLLAYLDMGQRKVMAFIWQHTFETCVIKDLNPCFANINTPEAYHSALQEL